MSKYRYIFLTKANGVERLRCAEGASYVQDSVVLALKAARPNDHFTVVECPEPGYQSLKREILFIHGGVYRDLDTIKRYCKALGGKVVGSRWVVKLYDEDGDLYSVSGVSNSYERAEKHGEAEVARLDCLDYYMVELVKDV